MCLKLWNTINKSGDIFLDNDLVGKINIYTSIDDNYFLSIGDKMSNIIVYDFKKNQKFSTENIRFLTLLC